MEEEIDLRRYLQVLLRYAWLIVSLALLSALVAFLVSTTTAPRQYNATASVLISQSYSQITFDPRFQTVDSANMLARSYALNQQSHRAALVALVRNGHVAEAVMEQLGDESLRPVQLLSMVSGRIGGGAGTSDGNSDVIDITVTCGEPDRAAEIANAWAEAYVAHVNVLYGSRPESYASVQQQALSEWQVYREAEEALLSFLAASRAEELDARLAETQSLIDEMLDDRQETMAVYYETRRKTEQLLDDAGALLSQIQSGGKGNPATNQLALLMLKSQVFASSADLPAQLQIQIGAADAAEVDAGSQQADVEALIDVLERRVAGLDGSIKEASAAPVPVLLGQLYDQKRALVVEREQVRAQEKELVRARDLVWETYSTLQVKAAELGIATQTADVEVVFASPAVEPLRPVGRSHLLYAGVAGASGLAFGMLFVLGLDYLRPGFDLGASITSRLRRSQRRS